MTFFTYYEFRGSLLSNKNNMFRMVDLMDRTNATLVALRRILRRTEFHRREVAQSVGLTSVQLRLLKLTTEGQCATAKSLAIQMHVSQATVTTLLDKLETRGLITRKISASDRRQKMILLTEKGQHALDNVHDPMQRNFAARFEQLEEWEQSMMLASVERIAALLEADPIEIISVLPRSSYADEVEAGVFEAFSDDLT